MSLLDCALILGYLHSLSTKRRYNNAHGQDHFSPERALVNDEFLRTSQHNTCYRCEILKHRVIELLLFRDTILILAPIDTYTYPQHNRLIDSIEDSPLLFQAYPDNTCCTKS